MTPKNQAIPSIMSEFSDTSNIAWYPAAYSLTTCALIPLAGKLSTVLPLRWVYQAFFAVFLVGSAVCGAATSSDMFIVGRALAGVGASGVASGGLNVVLAVSAPATRAMHMGLVSGMFGLGIVLAPIIGGAFTQHVSWRWCFYVNLPAGAVTLASMFFFFRPPRIVHAEQSASLRERLRHLDFVGCLLFVPACFMVLMALEWGGVKFPWRSATVIGLFVGGGVLVTIFIGWQWYMGRYALIPGSVVRRRAVALGCIFAFCQLGGLAVMSYYLPEWFQAVQGASPMESGVRVLPSVISQIVGIVIVGIFGECDIKFYSQSWRLTMLVQRYEPGTTICGSSSAPFSCALPPACTPPSPPSTRRLDSGSAFKCCKVLVLVSPCRFQL